MDKKYEKIINMPHHVSSNRAQMPLSQRAAQFAPFAALTGYGDVLAETARQTERQIDLTEGEVAAIDEKLRWLKENLDNLPAVELRVFSPDKRKEGGSYHTVFGRIVKIDEYRQMLWLDTGEKVKFEQIMKLFIR